ATAAGNGSLTGVRSSWNPDPSANESEPKLGMLQVPIYDLTGCAISSIPLALDSYADMMLRYMAFQDAEHQKERVILIGTGLGQPVGILNHLSCLSVTRETANTITLKDIGGMLAALLPVANPKTTAWVTNPTAFAKLIDPVNAANEGIPTALYFDNDGTPRL